MDEASFRMAFTELRPLGAGAQGTVQLVAHNKTSSKYVLKQIPLSDRAASSDAAALLEVDVLSRLAHPNITQMYGAWRNGRAINILMEYADGGTLADVLKAREHKGALLDEEVVLEWFVQIVGALRSMHASSILHRDLKAANVFLTSRNLIKVGDFGIAKMLEKSGDLARTAIGTPYYLAPEVINGEPYGLKADVWSLGVLLYELLTLKKPFEARALPQLALKILSARYEPLPASTSDELRALVTSMLQRDPSRRPSLDDIAQHSLCQRTESRLQAQLRSLAAIAMPSELASPGSCRSPSAGSRPPTLSSTLSSVTLSSPGTPAAQTPSRRPQPRHSGSREARQHACGLRMRIAAEAADAGNGRSSSKRISEGSQPPAMSSGGAQQLLQASLEDNMRFAQNLQALEFNLQQHAIP